MLTSFYLYAYLYLLGQYLQADITLFLAALTRPFPSEEATLNDSGNLLLHSIHSAYMTHHAAQSHAVISLWLIDYNADLVIYLPRYILP